MSIKWTNDVERRLQDIETVLRAVQMRLEEIEAQRKGLHKDDLEPLLFRESAKHPSMLETSVVKRGPGRPRKEQ